ncbi:ogr/Delta-like zinc finger family protein [Brevundimonas pishanensis]|uniref:ogr/Delta-like zinc finger family protein n=1 Tax=Brevundimonas pishanensis TaxID=2896315 RepID=UPI003D02B1CB
MSIQQDRVSNLSGGRSRPPHSSGGTIRQICPHCEHVATARTTRTITPLFREMRFQCTNVDGDDPCGHTFVASLVIDRTIVPSARPNPDINLPIAPPRKKADQAITVR